MAKTQGNSPLKGHGLKKSSTKSKISDADADDLQLKLEFDKYLKNKTTASHKNLAPVNKSNLPLRNDFKMLMKEKNEQKMIEERQRQEMDRMYREFEKTIKFERSPVNSPKRKLQNTSRLFSNATFKIYSKQKSSMKDFFNPQETGFKSERRKNRNDAILSNFKTQIGLDFDTKSRINTDVLRSISRKSLLSKDSLPSPIETSYLIKKEFVPKRPVGEITYRRIKSDTPLIFRGFNFLHEVQSQQVTEDSEGQILQKQTNSGHKYLDRITATKLGTCI